MYSQVCFCKRAKLLILLRIIYKYFQRTLLYFKVDSRSPHVLQSIIVYII